MKNKNRVNQIAVFFCLILITGIVYPQDQQILQESQARQERDRKKISELTIVLGSTPQARALQSKLNSARSTLECENALKEYVSSENKSIVPYLKAQMEVGSGCQIEIQVALVKLGELDYLNKIIQDLSSQTIVNRIIAVEMLAKIGSKEAYKKLFELLDDNEDMNPGLMNRDYVVPPLSRYTVEWLGKTVANPVTGKDRYSVEAWKEWFERNRHLID